MDKLSEQQKKSIEFMNNPVEESHIIYPAKELIPHLLCPICRGLVREPIMGCNKCTIYGCGVCIENWKNYGKNPNCLSGCQNIKYQKVVNPLLKTVLDYILIKCPFSNNPYNFQKCREVLTYSKYLQHIENCQYKVRKCMYSSCGKKQILRLIKEHEKECKQKNPQIYFIFRHVEKTPMRIEIDMPMSTGIEQLLIALEDKLGIHRKNIELVMIKNHEIVEYIQRRKVSIQYLAVHDGFLFGFQKYPDEIFKKMENNSQIIEQQPPEETKENNSIDRQIHLELLIIDDVNKFKPEYLRYIRSDTQRCPSYTRVFHFSQYNSFKEIHLEVYGFFKQFLKNYYNLSKEQQAQDLPDYFEKINFKDYSKDVLEQEYESYFLQQGDNQKTDSMKSIIQQNKSEIFIPIPQNGEEGTFNIEEQKLKYFLSNSHYDQTNNQFQFHNNQQSSQNQNNKSNLKEQPFYKLVFKENIQTQLPYDNDKYFHDYYKLSDTNETQFILALVINPVVDVFKLKLNKCVQAPQTLQQMKRIQYVFDNNSNQYMINSQENEQNNQCNEIKRNSDVSRNGNKNYTEISNKNINQNAQNNLSSSLQNIDNIEININNIQDQNNKKHGVSNSVSSNSPINNELFMKDFIQQQQQQRCDNQQPYTSRSKQ